MNNNIQNDIEKWLYNRPYWLQEAAHRLLEKNNLNDEDIKSITERLKNPEQVQHTNIKSKFDQIGHHSNGYNNIRVNSIGDVQGIENLQPIKPINFGQGNLAAIYGPNASGKSGYVSIIKNACGKPRAPELKTNVFESHSSIQQCTLGYSIAGKEKSLTWKPDNGPIEELKPIDIFDQYEADYFIRQEAEVSYIPPEVALFEKLANVCSQVNSQLEEERKRLNSKLPTLPQEYSKTKIAKIYNHLSPDISGEYISKILNWTEEDKKRLEYINTVLNAGDLQKFAEKRKATKNQAQNIIKDVENATERLGQHECERIKQLKYEAIEKRKIATEYIESQTKSAQLEGVGTQTWKALWEAAREFSIHHAYKEKEFPVTEHDARCVLCHQKLDSNAQKRLQDFESYVKSKLETEAKQVEDELKEILSNLPKIPEKSELKTICQAAGLDENEWFPRLNRFWQQARDVLNILTGDNLQTDVQYLTQPSDVTNKLNSYIQQLENEITDAENNLKDINFNQLKEEKIDLQAKQWCSQQSEAVREEIKRLKKQKQLEEWKDQVSSYLRAVSNEAKKLSRDIVTSKYIERFNKELKELGASHIKVELDSKGAERGKVKHGVKLKEIESSSEDVIYVLSEGERQIVALAAFLADVTGKKEQVPLIFDDPISSLDDEFELAVANRLTKLAKERQVLVFTHRLSMWGYIYEATKSNNDKNWPKKNFSQLCIQEFNGTCGHPISSDIWNHNTEGANQTLIDRLSHATKAFYDSGDDEQYQIYAKSICLDFRILLERTVEEDLLLSVVKRHRRSITTETKLTQLPKIEKGDCDFLDRLISKYSQYLHSQSEQAFINVPDENELRHDLESLKNWRKDYKSRSTNKLE